jgi:hypothetical protein
MINENNLTVQMREECDYSDQILEIIDNVDSYTRSDLQGVVEALVRKIMRESSNNLCKKCGRTVE